MSDILPVVKINGTPVAPIKIRDMEIGQTGHTKNESFSEMHGGLYDDAAVWLDNPPTDATMKVTRTELGFEIDGLWPWSMHGQMTR